MGTRDTTRLAELRRAAVARRQLAQRYRLAPGEARGRGPASAAQAHLLAREREVPGQGAYIVRAPLDLVGPLDATALHTALRGVARDHDLLRSCLVPGDPLELEAFAPDDVALDHALVATNTADPETAVVQLLEHEVRTPFDPTRAPLWRTRLVRLDDHHHVLVVLLHHVIADNGSKRIFVEALRTHYEHALRGTAPASSPPRLGYRDYARWQRSLVELDAFPRHAKFWRSAATVAPAFAPSPTAGPAHVLRTTIDAALMARVTAFLAAHDVTLFVLLLGVLHTLLGRATDRDQVVVATPVGNRPLPVLRDLIGPFATTVLVRGDLFGAPTTLELFARTKARTVEAIAHADLPLDRALTDNHVLFTLQHPKLGPRSFGGATIRSFSVDAEIAARAPLAFNATPSGDALILSCVYRAAAFEEAAVERLCADFVALLATMVA